MWKLIITIHFLHLSPELFSFEMYDEQTCWETGMIIENDLKTNHLVTEVNHLCVNVLGE